MIGILKQSAADMPGCISYIVSKDTADENSIWVTEVWDSQASHDASLSLPAVKDAIPRGKAIVLNFERIAVTTPCGELVCQSLTPADPQTALGVYLLRRENDAWFSRCMPCLRDRGKRHNLCRDSEFCGYGDVKNVADCVEQLRKRNAFHSGAHQLNGG
jgi:quinol monooxygenase YgiN